LIELLLALVVVGVVLGFVLPQSKPWLQRESVRSARRAVTTELARARAIAAQRGCLSTLHLNPSNSTVWVTVCSPDGTGTDTLGAVNNLSIRHDVSFTADRTTVRFTPHGLAFEINPTVVVFTREGFSDTLAISPLGRPEW
jgi:Tfp pilus assembly protein FimT